MKVKVSECERDLLKQWSSVFKALGCSVEFLEGSEEVCLNGIPNDSVKCRNGESIILYCNGVNITLVQEQMKCEFSIEDSEKVYNLCIAVNNPSDEMRKNGEMFQITASLNHGIKGNPISGFRDFFLDIRQYINGAKVNKSFYEIPARKYGIPTKKVECKVIPSAGGDESYADLIKSGFDEFDVVKNNQEVQKKLSFITMILIRIRIETLEDYINSLSLLRDDLKRKAELLEEINSIIMACGYDFTQIDATTDECQIDFDAQDKDGTYAQSPGETGRGGYVKVGPTGTPMGSGKYKIINSQIN